MSFQGIRKIRDAKRASPVVFSSMETHNPFPIKSFQFTFDLKSSNLSSDIRTTRDSEVKADTSARQARKNIFGATSTSKDKQKKVVLANFLNADLGGLKSLRPSWEIKNQLYDVPNTDRPLFYKSKSQNENEEVSRITPNSFTYDFVVGKGGFGKVWKVHEKGTNKIYAMKEMQKVKIISKRSVSSVMNEQLLLQKLKYPFLINMVYSFQNRENLYLVMEYCNRGDLRYHLGNRRNFTEEQTKFFLACIILCLEYMHGKRVIHRDLKPENLVLDDKGYVRITDLGVSREVIANNAEDTSGTPGYMAPQVICKMDHSYPVDFFALGVIAYEFMTGKRPYLGKNRKQIRESILSKQVQLDQIPPFGWSRQSIDFINRLIQRKPQYRLGFKGIEQVKYHPFFKKFDWQRLEQRRIQSPFMPDTIQDDYINYQECISEDTEIQDIEDYQMILRHKDTQEAFAGYDWNTSSPRPRKKSERLELESLTPTPMSMRKRK